MTLWFVFALMTAAAIFAVLWPLGRGTRAQVRAGSDLAVYRDQLEEIARDRTTGLIGAAEAEGARVEVSRRLIAAADSHFDDAPATGSSFRRRATAVAVLIALPAIAAALYLKLGSPELPGQPLAARATTPTQERTLDTLVAQVEDHLAKNPDDGRGWEVVAPVYMRLGRFDDAVKARRNALRLNSGSAVREADLGESLMAQANGVVTDDAKAAFERALTHDLKNLKARFFLGVAAHQDGETAKATDIWRGMLQDARPDSPWIGMVREALASIEGTSEAASAQQPAPGPNAEDVAAAEQMKPEDRNVMVRGMVDRLAERLKRDGSDLEGWLRLVRAYTVLGERERALSALADARRAFGHDTDKLRRLDELVKELKLEG
jgi:cytochrome c-type biogenesis protein CcmH